MAACTGEDVNVTCLVPLKCHSLMGMAQCSPCLDFAALMASLGFCSLPKAVLRGFQAWGCLLWEPCAAAGWREEAMQEALAVHGHGRGQWPWGARASLWVERGAAGQLRGSAQGRGGHMPRDTLHQRRQRSKHDLVPVHPCEGGGRGQPGPLLCHRHSSPFLCAAGNLRFLPSQCSSRLNRYQM